MLFLALGELLSFLMKGFMPGSVIGMFLLFASLKFRILKPEDVEQAAIFLTENMGFFFIPAGVGLVTQLPLLKANGIAILVAMIVSTILVMFTVGALQSRFEKKIEKQLEL